MSEKKRALVTGANRGIGAEICRQLVDAGVEVVVTSRKEEAGQALARQIGAACLPLDVTSRESIDALVHRLEGPIDILINNAGVTFDGFDADVARKTLDVNFFGPVHLCEALRPKIRDESGRIVMVSSGLGELSGLGGQLRDWFGTVRSRDEIVEAMERFVREVAEGRHTESGWPSSAYRVSKVGLNAYTRALAQELTASGSSIKVNAACPGWVRTDMGGPHASSSVEEGARTPVWLALLGPDGPSGGFFRDEAPIAW